MMRILTSRAEAREFQDELVNLLEMCSEKVVTHTAKYSGGERSEKTYVFPNRRIWAMPYDGLRNRYWNSFGVIVDGKLSSQISVDMNHRFEGAPRNIAGRFLKDGNRSVLAHTGELRGTKGIARQFMAELEDRKRDLGIGKSVYFYAYLDDGERALDQIAQYVHAAQEKRSTTASRRKK